MSEPELVAIKVSSILTCLLWTKVFATNIGLGGAKKNAGQRAPEDKYQINEAEASEAAKDSAKRAQRIVNNDLENIPYTMVLAWVSVFCIFSVEDFDVRKRLSTLHIVFFSLFVLCRVCHSVVYSLGYTLPRSLFYLIGVVSSFALAIIGAIAAFNITSYQY
mmetsp:Transcript_28063/g.32336  ORF Transcript_28063/g.32336 Transcript_28063/m.32336 type:complete len:162 (+) Transcript_28063:52-537(+)